MMAEADAGCKMCVLVENSCTHKSPGDRSGSGILGGGVVGSKSRIC